VKCFLGLIGFRSLLGTEVGAVEHFMRVSAPAPCESLHFRAKQQNSIPR